MSSGPKLSTLQKRATAASDAARVATEAAAAAGEGAEAAFAKYEEDETTAREKAADAAQRKFEGLAKKAETAVLKATEAAELVHQHPDYDPEEEDEDDGGPLPSAGARAAAAPEVGDRVRYCYLANGPALAQHEAEIAAVNEDGTVDLVTVDGEGKHLREWKEVPRSDKVARANSWRGRDNPLPKVPDQDIANIED